VGVGVAGDNLSFDLYTMYGTASLVKNRQIWLRKGRHSLG